MGFQYSLSFIYKCAGASQNDHKEEEKQSPMFKTLTCYRNSSKTNLFPAKPLNQATSQQENYAQISNQWAVSHKAHSRCSHVLGVSTSNDFSTSDVSTPRPLAFHTTLEQATLQY